MAPKKRNPWGETPTSPQRSEQELRESSSRFMTWAEGAIAFDSNPISSRPTFVSLQEAIRMGLFPEPIPVRYGQRPGFSSGYIMAVFEREPFLKALDAWRAAKKITQSRERSRIAKRIPQGPSPNSLTGRGFFKAPQTAPGYTGPQPSPSGGSALQPRASEESSFPPPVDRSAKSS